MIYFVGAGPGAVDLITVRGQRLLAAADIIIYAGSLVNTALLAAARPGCLLYDSAGMTLEEVLEVLVKGEERGLLVVRLHTGDPSLYGAIAEQMAALDKLGLAYEVVPGVSAFNAAAAVLKREYTQPGLAQSLIITRLAGRTAVPEGEALTELAAHQTSMAIFLSTAYLAEVCRQLILGGYAPDTLAALVYKATWPEERVFRGTLETLAERVQGQGIDRTALILVGRFLAEQGELSRLYDASFGHGFREARE